MRFFRKDSMEHDMANIRAFQAQMYELAPEHPRHPQPDIRRGRPVLHAILHATVPMAEIIATHQAEQAARLEEERAAYRNVEWIFRNAK